MIYFVLGLEIWGNTDNGIVLRSREILTSESHASWTVRRVGLDPRHVNIGHTVLRGLAWPPGPDHRYVYGPRGGRVHLLPPCQTHGSVAKLGGVGPARSTRAMCRPTGGAVRHGSCRITRRGRSGLTPIRPARSPSRTALTPSETCSAATSLGSESDRTQTCKASRSTCPLRVCAEPVVPCAPLNPDQDSVTLGRCDPQLCVNPSAEWLRCSAFSRRLGLMEHSRRRQNHARNSRRLRHLPS